MGARRNMSQRPEDVESWTGGSTGCSTPYHWASVEKPLTTLPLEQPSHRALRSGVVDLSLQHKPQRCANGKSLPPRAPRKKTLPVCIVVTGRMKSRRV